jgi:uroporphyrinogen-III decarboxylase
MTSRERVSAALERRVPDRIPFGEFAIDFDTVERLLGHETYVRAKAKCRIAFWEGRRDEVVQSWKEDGVELFRKLDCIDVVNLNVQAFGIAPARGEKAEAPRRTGDGTWEDREGRIYKLSDLTGDITVISDPVAQAREYTMAEFEAPPAYMPPDPSVFEAIDHLIAHLGKDRLILGPSGSPSGLVMLGETEQAYERIALEPDLVRAAAAQLARLGELQDPDYIRPGQDGTLWGQDFSASQGPMVSPATFRDLVVPFMKARTTSVKQRGQYVVQHACGNNWPLLDSFVEIGFDCYQSIQKSASMDLGAVMRKYGDRMCLWGGVPVEHLVGGTPADIRVDVRAAVETARSIHGGAGYIFGSTHSIAVGTKYDNFMAMVDEFERVRG